MKNFNKRLALTTIATLFSMTVIAQNAIPWNAPKPLDIEAYKDQIIFQDHNDPVPSGNRQVILQEDFHLFREGTEENPDTTNVVMDVYNNNCYLNPNLMQDSGWIGYFIYQAGEKAYMGDWYYAFIDTPEMVMQGTVHISFKGRLRSGTQNQTVVGLCIDPVDPRPYDMKGFYMTSEWQQYEFDLNSPSSNEVFIQINGFTTWYLDDVVITLDTDGVGESSEANIAVYPNPANDKVCFGSPVDEVTVYDMKGSQVLGLNNTSEVDTSMIPSGLYLFKMRNNDGIHSTKQVMVKH